ncbi:28999_t:CDS:2 [Gigaspora margarita]|uniref:28999_t:CDS:1 n=1 Tax=Gigaspora margarita TaxID=4874 RepID=A0ABN7V044_GIGMA|nr:28999_t:CDS:2 [Gigaspora margarita]
MSFLSLPEYNGSCHPDDWLRNFKFVAAFLGRTASESELVNLALLKISRSIYNDKNIQISKFSQLIEFLKADPSFKIFKINSEQKLLALRFTYLTHVQDFTIELRQLLFDAEIFDLKLQKQSILKILPTKLFPDAYSLKIAESLTINDVFINLKNFLLQYKRVVKYGSVITLRHIDTGKLLSSSLERYTGGSKQYWAYAVDRRATDYESWTVMPKVLLDAIPPEYGGDKEKGSPVYYGDKITLMNNGTGQKLHSHLEFESPITSQQEVTCQTFNDGNDNWNVQHYIYDVDSKDKEPWNECHDIFLFHSSNNLGLNSHDYMLNDEYQEVTCFGDKKVNTTKWRADILDDFVSNK